MPLVLTSGPAAEPVTVAEAKAHMRVDGSAEDALIASLILTSRLHIETALGLALMTQSWRLVLDEWPRPGPVAVPIAPVQSVEAVNVRSLGGAITVVEPAEYVLDGASRPPRLVAVNGSWPAPGRKTGGIEIELTAGYGSTAASVPAPIRQALLLLVAHWYEHREPIEVGKTSTRIPDAVSDLLLPYRKVRL